MPAVWKYWLSQWQTLFWHVSVTSPQTPPTKQLPPNSPEPPVNQQITWHNLLTPRKIYQQKLGKSCDILTRAICRYSRAKLCNLELITGKVGCYRGIYTPRWKKNLVNSKDVRKLLAAMGATTGGIGGPDLPKIETDAPPFYIAFWWIECDYVTDCTKLGRPAYFFL